MDQPYHQMENSLAVHTCSLCTCTFQILPGTFSHDVRMFPSTAKGKRYKLVRTCKCPNPSCPSSVSKVIQDVTDTPPISKKLAQLVDKANEKGTTKCLLISPPRETIGQALSCRCGYQGCPNLSAIYRSPVSNSQQDQQVLERPLGARGSQQDQQVLERPLGARSSQQDQQVLERPLGARSSQQDPFVWKTSCPKCSSILVAGPVESISFDCHPR